MSQSKLRDSLDIQGYSRTESAISKWENGKHIPEAEIVEVLEDILMPKSLGLLLRAAGYYSEAEIRFPSSDIVRKQMTQQDEKLSEILRLIISNLEKYLGESATILRYSDKLEHTVYGNGSAPAILANLKSIDEKAAKKVLKRIKEGFPDLADIDDWANLPHERISEDFIQRLISKAHRGGF